MHTVVAELHLIVTVHGSGQLYVFKGKRKSLQNKTKQNKNLHKVLVTPTVTVSKARLIMTVY